MDVDQNEFGGPIIIAALVHGKTVSTADYNQFSISQKSQNIMNYIGSSNIRCDEIILYINRNVT
jgi:hypothetical protein